MVEQESTAHKVIGRLESGEDLMIFIDKCALSQADVAHLITHAGKNKYHGVIVLTNGEASELVKLAKDRGLIDRD
jgi:hypothetical protein